MTELSVFENLTGLKKLPADAAGAWASLDWLSRCHYSPTAYLGKTEAEGGAQYWFIAEQVVIYPTPVRRLVLMSIIETGEEYAVGEEPALVLAA